ncbi:peptidase [Aliidiomarina taiwanensis]|uniref:Peptidase n=2 Tax=Aliidiomarina taiwanensis TaxID=946228 RepID=A0A432XAW8_9GAMM|nr:M23 family metallopeptidase [Aliidiomarina taiwanensis]RUO44456.1 peptidase [Aliidiomarina taiwanensis]
MCVLVVAAFWGRVYAADMAPTLQGHFEQGGIVFGHTNPSTRVQLNGEPVQVSTNGHFVFGFGRDETGPVELKLTASSGEVWQQSYPIASRTFDIQRIDGLPKRTVTPDPEVVAEIRKNNEEVWIARQHRTEREDFANGFIWPAEGRISGVYGSQRVLNGNPRTPHYGLDVAAPTGTPVVAPAGGIVRLAHPDMVLSGGTMIIDHGYGFFSTFLHLSAMHVEVGQEVKQGEVVAEIGATGRATGPHLDWRINWGNVRLDPQYLVPKRN